MPSNLRLTFWNPVAASYSIYDSTYIYSAIRYSAIYSHQINELYVGLCVSLHRKFPGDIVEEIVGFIEIGFKQSGWEDCCNKEHNGGDLSSGGFVTSSTVRGVGNPKPDTSATEYSKSLRLVFGKGILFKELAIGNPVIRSCHIWISPLEIRLSRIFSELSIKTRSSGVSSG